MCNNRTSDVKPMEDIQKKYVIAHCVVFCQN